MANWVFQIEDDLVIPTIIEKMREVFCRFYTARAALSNSRIAQQCGELLPADEYGNTVLELAESWIGATLEKAYGCHYVGNRQINHHVVYSRIQEMLLDESEEIYRDVRVPYGFTLDFSVHILDNQTVLFQGIEHDYFADGKEGCDRNAERYLRFDQALRSSPVIG